MQLEKEGTLKQLKTLLSYKVCWTKKSQQVKLSKDGPIFPWDSFLPHRSTTSPSVEQFRRGVLLFLIFPIY